MARETTAALILKPGREKSILHRHPWIFSGAVDQVDGDPASGETVAIRSSRGEWLAWAAYSPASQIRARIWSWKADVTIGIDFLKQRIDQALTIRRTMIPPGETNALRLVHAESDGLPGLIVDRYGELLVMQVLTAGAEFWREPLADLLVEMTGISDIVERSDVDVRHLEGLPERVGVMRGGKDFPQRVQIQENGLKFWVDPLHGHKTGFYLDQRRNRAAVGSLAAGRSVLNCFSYTGGFAAYCLADGAESVLSIDSSADVMAMGAENIALNHLPDHKAEWQQGDVFQVLRTLRDQAKSFDMVILDPPKFAQTAAQAERAARGYKDINLLAFKLLRPGGLLATFSCSGGVSEELFQKIVAGSALDAGVNARITGYLHQGPDHPVALNFPEGSYLKGLICAV